MINKQIRRRFESLTLNIQLVSNRSPRRLIILFFFPLTHTHPHAPTQVGYLLDSFLFPLEFRRDREGVGFACDVFPVDCLRRVKGEG